MSGATSCGGCVVVHQPARALREHGDARLRAVRDPVKSAEKLSQLWSDLASEPVDVHLEPFTSNERGEGSSRSRYLPPMAVEVQFHDVG